MFERRSLGLPITLGVVMIVLVVLLIVGWVVISVFAATQPPHPVLVWTMLAVGTSLLAMVLVGVVIYLTLTIKAINLTQRQSNFVDSVTHELKSPIASLKLCLQTVTRCSVTDSERESIQQYMLDDVERLDQLINHLLDAARTARRTEVSEQAEVRLDRLLRECAQAACIRYRVPEDVVQFDIPPCRVHASREDLMILFRNLLDNAIKYAGDAPRVWLTVRQEHEDELLVDVADNGRGIPAHLRRRVFGRFVRLGRELERDRPGTGLGLYIVRSIVHRMRCRIRVLEGPEGKGTRFEVTLPASMRPGLLPEPAVEKHALEEEAGQGSHR
jgi:two-component system, OmpR family, phosphate regulon sensor histidine kinase PhoR